MDGPEPLVKRADSVDYRTVSGADGLKRADLLGETDDVPNFELRKYVVEPGVDVGKHRNAIEHEQYVLNGRYTLGIGEREVEVAEGDSILIPAGTVHWYRNDTDATATYLCVVPLGEEGTEFL